MRAVNVAVVGLDNLAKQVDQLIDVPNESSQHPRRITDLDSLEQDILHCFQRFPESARKQRLVDETRLQVELSFKLNTTERHALYSLANTRSNGCTTAYLLPLADFMFEVANRPSNPDVFVLFSNYIQMLDDFVDVFDDISLGIRTPVSVRLAQLRHIVQDRSFNVLAGEVNEALDLYLEAILGFVPILADPRIAGFDWRQFNARVRAISPPMLRDWSGEVSYVRRIRKIIPPILCYS
jgi:hypothetical protein